MKLSRNSLLKSPRTLVLSGIIASLGTGALAQSNVTINQAQGWAEVDRPYITVSRASGSGAETFPISTNHPEALTLPASISFSTGETSKYFYFDSKAVTDDLPTTITVGSKSVAFTVKCVFVTTTSTNTDIPIGGGTRPYQYIYLPCNAKPGGFEVMLSSTNPSVISLPASATIQGSSQTYFYLDTFEVGQDTNVTINALLNGHVTPRTYTVKPIFVSPLNPSVTQCFGGDSTDPYVYAYLATGPRDPYSLKLASSNPSVLAVPDKLDFTAGGTSRYFYFVTSPVSSPTLVTVSAKSAFLGANAPEKTCQILVKPNAPTLATSQTSLYGGATSKAYHYLTFQSGLRNATAVPISSDLPNVLSVPATVNIGAGGTANYVYSTSYPTNRDEVVTLTANYYGNIAKVKVLVKANRVIDNTFSPAYATGGQGSPYTYFVLGAPAPAGGADLEISSSDPSVLQIPSTLTIGANSTQNYRYFTTSAVTRVRYPRIISTWNGRTYQEAFAVLNPGYNDVSGVISYGGLQSLADGPRTVDIELRTPNTTNVVQTFTNVPVDDDGAYSIDMPAGTYDMSIKVGTWLRKTLEDVPAFAVYKNFDLINGDVDDDNSVSVFDYLELSNAFDTAEGDPNWNPRADLDLDGIVSVFDYLILSDAFDTYGDE
ncbi:MAG: hypothetical protein JST40_12650 [Armatimonadetes bacterium]|nr:hypothetical protein [Armatimonadota bacterium]